MGTYANHIGGKQMSLFIEIKELTITYNGVNFLKNINLNINEGEVIGILGRSGDGKTILMHALRGAEEYENISGSIIYHLARFLNVNTDTAIRYIYVLHYVTLCIY